MRWKSDKLTCTPPGSLLPHRKTGIRVNGELSEVIWLPEQSCLQVIDEQGVERRIRVRSFASDPGNDPSQMQIRIESYSDSSHPGLSAFTVSPDVPGQDARAAVAAAAGAQIRSPITGKVLQVLVKNDQHVPAGEVVAIVEAMKMENKILTPIAGVIKDLSVKAGESVATSANICRIGPANDN